MEQKPKKIKPMVRLSQSQIDSKKEFIRQYIEYLEDAFVINRANRYNVKGRKYIGTPLKYYF